MRMSVNPLNLLLLTFWCNVNLGLAINFSSFSEAVVNMSVFLKFTFYMDGQIKFKSMILVLC